MNKLQGRPANWAGEKKRDRAWNTERLQSYSVIVKLLLALGFGIIVYSTRNSKERLWSLFGHLGTGGLFS